MSITARALQHHLQLCLLLLSFCEKLQVTFNIQQGIKVLLSPLDSWTPAQIKQGEKQPPSAFSRSAFKLDTAVFILPAQSSTILAAMHPCFNLIWFFFKNPKTPNHHSLFCLLNQIIFLRFKRVSCALITGLTIKALAADARQPSLLSHLSFHTVAFTVCSLLKRLAGCLFISRDAVFTVSMALLELKFESLAFIFCCYCCCCSPTVGMTE